MLNEALKGDQHKLDHDNDGDIDGKDFAMLRMKKKKKKMDSPTKDEPEGENGDTASMNPKIGDKTKKEYSMSMKPSKKKLYMSKEEVDVDDILSLDEASFDNYIDDMTIEELKELEEGIIGGTVKMIGKGIGALAKGAMGAGKLAAKGASAAANRMSASGRADAAERKLSKVRNKAVDIQRRIRAKKAAKVIARGGYSKYDPAKFQQKRVNYQMAHTEYEGEVMKESPIRTALKSVVENRGEHYRSATPPETIDDKLKGGGAKKMKADLMKGAKMNDTVAKAPEDAKAAGSRGPSAKPRNSGDNIRKGDTKIIQGGTPMKDPSSPKQRLESIINAYKSMSEMMGNIGVRGSDGKAMGSAPRASSSSSYAGRHNDALSTLNRMTKKHDDRDHIDHAHALKAIDHAGGKLNKHGPDHAEYKKAFDAAKKKSAEAMKSESVKTGVGTLGNIMDAYQSMNQQDRGSQ